MVLYFNAANGFAIMKVLVILFCFCWSYVLAGTATFTLTLTWATGAPDGVERKMIFVNDKFPAPTLFINQGDNVEVEVVNKMPEDTTVHFHGEYSLDAFFSANSD